MKNIMLWWLLIIVLGCNSNRTKVISGLEGKPLPAFNMLLMDSTTHLNTQNIPAGQPLVLFYFSPFCPYCRAQTEEIKSEIESLKNIQFYFLAAFPLYEIKSFDKRYGLSSYNNVTLAQIRDTSFGKYYKIHGVPYIAIYDKQKYLKEVLLGKTDVDVIKEIAFGK